MLVAVVIGVIGVILGVLFATGVFAGDDPVVAPPPAAPAPSDEVAPSGSGGAAAEPTAEPATPTTEPTTADPAGEVRAFKSVATGLCLEPVAEEPEGADIQQVACTGAPAQQWQALPAGDDTVTLVNTASGKCLDVDSSRKDDSAPIQQWSCNGGNNQRWRLTPGTAESDVVGVDSGKCLDVPNGTAQPGLRIQQWTCAGTPNQRWTTG